MTAQAFGNEVIRLFDVGVAGLHRLLARRDAARRGRRASSSSPAWRARWPAWSAGSSPAGDRGADRDRVRRQLRRLAPLLAMLNGCASGVTVVNIDNGFGAAYAATLMNRASK